MEIAVTQVVADRELMFSHLCQHRPNRVPKRVPAHADDANLRKGLVETSCLTFASLGSPLGA